MASTSSTSSSTLTTATMANSLTQINPLLLLLSNMSSMKTVELDYSNYIVWKHQIEVILETYSMIDAIDETTMAPDQFLTDSSRNVTTGINPAFWVGRIVSKHYSHFLTQHSLLLFLLSLLDRNQVEECGKSWKNVLLQCLDLV